MQIKILSLGDRYSAGAQRYIAKIAKYNNEEIIAGNLMLPDATLEKHQRALSLDLPEYRFEFNEEGSVRLNVIENCKPSKALNWQDWDYITVQQGAELAGLPDSYFPYLSDILKILKEVCPGSQPILHETWAFSARCRKPEFLAYGGSAEKMAEAVCAAVKAAAQKTGISIVLPVGEAWRYMRRTYPDFELTTDGCHGNRQGDFLSSAVWYEMITGNDISKNHYRLPFVEGSAVESLKNAAHRAANQYRLYK